MRQSQQITALKWASNCVKIQWIFEKSNHFSRCSISHPAFCQLLSLLWWPKKGLNKVLCHPIEHLRVVPMMMIFVWPKHAHHAKQQSKIDFQPVSSWAAKKWIIAQQMENGRRSSLRSLHVGFGLECDPKTLTQKIRNIQFLNNSSSSFVSLQSWKNLQFFGDYILNTKYNDWANSRRSVM